jgi:hypothetical protein
MRVVGVDGGYQRKTCQRNGARRRGHAGRPIGGCGCRGRSARALVVVGNHVRAIGNQRGVFVKQVGRGAVFLDYYDHMLNLRDVVGLAYSKGRQQHEQR